MISIEDRNTGRIQASSPRGCCTFGSPKSDYRGQNGGRNLKQMTATASAAPTVREAGKQPILPASAGPRFRFSCHQTSPVHNAMESLITSKQRVSDHGEVFTGGREVNAMLDLVKQETERVDSRFLEPACGNGNFLAAILERKLSVVERRYSKSQLEYERNAVLAVASIYGIDKLEDNVTECRQRLFEVFDRLYTAQFKHTAKEECRESIKYILGRNIVHGDALTLLTMDRAPRKRWRRPRVARR